MNAMEEKPAMMNALPAARSLHCAAIMFACLTTGHSATLTGSITSYMNQSDETNVDLTTIGNLDWAVWGEGDSTGLSPTNSKAGGSLISDLTDINPNGIVLRGLGQFGDFGQTSYQWSDGTPTVAADSVNASIQHMTNYGDNPLGAGFGVHVSGSTSGTRTVDVWFGTHRGTTEITATIPGAAPVSFSIIANEFDNDNFNTFGHATFTFQCDSPTDSLYITTVMTASSVDSDFSNAYLSALTVSGQAIPEPSTFALGGLGLLGLLRRRRPSACS